MTGPLSKPGPRRHAGFTLVELMVGVVLGMLAVIIIANVFTTAEGQKRTTTSGSDAQVAGSLALHAVQRDVRMAGYGLAGAPAALGCAITAQFNSTAVTGLRLVAAEITFGSLAAGGTSDQIRVLAASRAGAALPMKLTAAHAQAGARFEVASTLGVGRGDLLVLAQAEWDGLSACSLVQAPTDGSGVTATTIPRAVAAPWNANASSFLPAAGYPAGSLLFNLGAPLARTYRIDTATWSLRSSDLVPTAAAPVVREVAPQIVLLRALYGKDTDGDGVVDLYDRVAPTTNAQWRQVMALRVALVARSVQFERTGADGDLANRTLVTPNAPQWDVGPQADSSLAAACGSSRCITLDLSHLGADWQRYRYRVYDTVVPLRNAVWNP
ncbi:MAG: PilW family protein [Pseudomonadota bacterium]